MRWYLGCLLLGWGMPAAAISSDYQLHVKFDHTVYSLRRQGTAWEYRDGLQRYRLTEKRCNQAALRGFQSEMARLLEGAKASTSTLRGEESANYDVILKQGSAETRVARGSALGTYLRKLPTRLFYLQAQTRMQCKKG